MNALKRTQKKNNKNLEIDCTCVSVLYLSPYRRSNCYCFSHNPKYRIVSWLESLAIAMCVVYKYINDFHCGCNVVSIYPIIIWPDNKRKWQCKQMPQLKRMQFSCPYRVGASVNCLKLEFDRLDFVQNQFSIVAIGI